MTVVSGVVLEASAPLKAAFGLAASDVRMFLRGEDVRAVKYPTAVRWLGEIGPLRLGAAVVDGRVLPCIDARAISPTSRGAGLVVSVSERGESVVLIDARVVALRSCEPAGAGRVVFDGAEIASADVVRCFDELHRAALELGKSSRARDRDDRRTS